MNNKEKIMDKNDIRIEDMFTESSLFQSYLDVEAALAKAQAKIGVIPKEAADKIASLAKLELLDIEAVHKGLIITGHGLVPLIWELDRICGPEAGGYIHWGATTQNITQTAKFKVILRNLQDIAIGEYIKPGNADGRPNNNDFSLQIIPNIPPDPIINFEAKVDENGENDVYLSWLPSKDQDVTGYFINRGAEEEILMTLSGRETRQTIDTNVPVGSYRYSIRAFKSQLLKSMASQRQVITVGADTSPPLPIMNLTIQTFGETVKLIWVQSPSQDVKKY